DRGAGERQTARQDRGQKRGDQGRDRGRRESFSENHRVDCGQGDQEGRGRAGETRQYRGRVNAVVSGFWFLVVPPACLAPSAYLSGVRMAATDPYRSRTSGGANQKRETRNEKRPLQKSIAIRTPRMTAFSMT